MAHGAPDHRLVIDLVELVKLIQKIERITRIDAIDSLGEISIAKVVPLIVPPVLIYDDFDSGVLKWIHDGDGRLDLSSERAFSGSGSMRIYTGPATGGTEFASRKFAVTSDLKMRVILRLSLISTAMVDFVLTLERCTGTEWVIAAVRYDVVGKKWQYATSPTKYEDIPGGAQEIERDLDTWHYLQLECDFATKKYVSLKCDALSIDMSAIDIYSSDYPWAQHAQLVLEVEAGAGDIAEAWIDDVFVETW